MDYVSNRFGDNRWEKQILFAGLVTVGLVLLYIIQVQNYLLFHSIVEIVSIVVAFAVFIVSWNARKEIESSFIAIVGISYLFVGGLDLLHTLAYQGMGVFPGHGADLPTQLWIFSRYVESISFLGAATVGVVANQRQLLDIEWNDRQLLTLVAGYSVVVGLALSSIFFFDAFPRTYVAGSGLTNFKVISEYAIIALFGCGLVVLYQQRSVFNEYVFLLLSSSIVLTMGAELAFTFYVDVYGFSNAVGHFVKLASFYLIYLAVVKTGFTEPEKALYRELAQREAETRKFKKAADYSGHSILITDREGEIQYVNEAWKEMTGYSAAEAEGENPRILKSGQHEEEFYEGLWETILEGDVWEGNLTNERKDGEQFVVHQTIAPIFRADNTIQGFVAVHDEITEQVEYEEQLEGDLSRIVQQLQVLSRVLRHNLRNEMNVVLANAEMVQNITTNEDVEEKAVSIEKKGMELLTLSEKQRDIVRLLSDPTTERSLTLTEVLGNVVEQLQKQYPHAEITVDIPADIQILAPSEFRQAIGELVENAIIHNDRETPKVQISGQLQEQTVQLHIEDNGPGIPTAERQVVTGQVEVDALLHSTGMGLWFVTLTISEMDGEVLFQDAEPRGTVVQISFPSAKLSTPTPPQGDRVGS